jgi:hypothetical protein
MSNNREKELCCGCGAPMHFDFLCKGCMQPLHYWESVDYDPTLEEYPHGPHYLCISCFTKKKPAVQAQKVNRICGSKKLGSTPVNGTEATDDLVLPIGLGKCLDNRHAMVHGDGGGIEKNVARMLHDVGVHVLLPEFPYTTELDLPYVTVAEPTVKKIIQHDGGKRRAPVAVIGAKSRNAGIVKRGGTSKKPITNAGAKLPKKHASRWRKEMADPLINQVVAFSVSRNLGKQIIVVLGHVWTDAAISHGHLIGMVTRKSAVKMSECSEPFYDVAWEYSKFGETAFSSPVLLGAINAGLQIVQL